MDWLFAPFQIFIAQPLLALVPALLFAIIWRARHRRSALVAAILWGLYALYELGISKGVLCDAECDIRVDLLLLAPLLLIVSLLALVASFRRR